MTFLDAKTSGVPPSRDAAADAPETDRADPSAASAPSASPAEGGGGAPSTGEAPTGPPCPLLAPLRLLRPGQWPKNLLVPLPLLGPAWHWETAGRVALATAAFVVASSLVYVVNDLADVERDRRHPVKRHRPLPSGQVSFRTAVLLAVALAGLLAVAATLLGPAASWPLLGYLVLNAAYSWKLKHFPLLDIFLVATGFVLRLLGGYQASGHPVSDWLVLAVLAACLVLILGKRRRELAVSGTGHRPALVGYSAHFVDLVLALCSALALIAYVLHVQTDPALPGAAAALTAPCALFALFRYLQVVVLHGEGGDPVRTLLRDPFMIADSLLWSGLLLLSHLA